MKTEKENKKKGGTGTCRECTDRITCDPSCRKDKGGKVVLVASDPASSANQNSTHTNVELNRKMAYPIELPAPRRIYSAIYSMNATCFEVYWNGPTDSRQKCQF